MLQEPAVGDYDSSHALYAFDDDSSHVAFLNLGAYALNVTELQVCGVPVSIDRCNDLGIVRNLHCKRCASVESLLEGDEDFLEEIIDEDEYDEIYGIYFGEGYEA